MRDIEKIKEEIFERSKRRIKKRKRIISAVVSLCVCCVVGVTLVTLYNPPVSSNNAMLEEGFGLSADEDYAPVSEKITKIKYGENEYTKEKKIIEITNALQVIIDDNIDDLADFADEESESSVKHHSTNDHSAESSLRLLIIITENGQEEFVINSDCLINKSTGAVYKMTEKLREELLKTLE